MLLPSYQNTNAALKGGFITLLSGLKKTSSDQDHEIIRSLVYIAVGLRRAAQTHVLQAMDLEEHLVMIERMLKECMSSDSMNDEKNVNLVLQRRENDQKLKYEHLSLTKARSLVSGPLELCIKYKLYAMIGTAQVQILNFIELYNIELMLSIASSYCYRCLHTWTAYSRVS